MKKITTLAIAAALAASMAVPTSAAPLLFSKTKFVSNGGSDIKSIVVTIGMNVDLSQYVPEREGYTFTGWFKDEALTEAVVDFRGGDVRTLYAGWEEIVIVPEEPEETEETEETETEETEAAEDTEETEAPVDTEETAE